MFFYSFNTILVLIMGLELMGPEDDESLKRRLHEIGWDEEFRSERGRLLYIESPEAYHKRKRSLMLLGCLPIAGSLLLLATMLPPPDFMSLTVLVGMLFIPVAFITFLGLRLIITSFHPPPWRIYERGIAAPALYGDEGFKLWSKMKDPEVKTSLNREGWLVIHYDKGRTIEIPRGIVEEGELREVLRGNEKVWMEDIEGMESQPDEELRKWMKNSTALLIVLSLMMALILTITMTFEMVHGSLLMMMSILIPWAVLIVLPIMLIQSREDDIIMMKDRRAQRFLMTIICVALVVFITSVLLSGNHAWCKDSSLDKTDEPGPSVLPQGVYSDEELNISGWITVRRGEILKLSNVTLNITTTSIGNGGIWVASGGRLEVRDTMISAGSPSSEYTFEIHGSALIERSDISGTMTKATDGRTDGGLEIYNDNVIISNTHFHGVNERGISIDSASPTIMNCTFERLEVGISASSSAATIEGCYFSDVNCSIWVVLDKTFIGDCTFINGTYGIETQWVSSTIIEGCTFQNYERAGILHTDYTDTTMSENTFENNTEDVRFITHSSLIGISGPNAVRNICVSVAFIGAGISALFILLFRHQSRREVDEMSKEKLGPGR